MIEAHWSFDQLEDYEERAAILEHDAGLPRVAAEFLANEMVEAKRGEVK